MFNLLRKVFIKDYQNVNDKVVREKHGILASVGGIIINLILFVIKLLVGIFTMSRSIISDAFNNLTDLVSNIVSLVGFKLTAKPADEEHPFGHERIEYITGLIISFIIIAVAIVLGYTSVISLINQDKSVKFSIASFIVLGVSIIGKIIQGLFYYSMGKAIDSVSLKANKQDSFNDAISTTVVLICALIVYFYPSLWWLDAATSLVVAAFILVTGIKLVKETTSPLIGSTPDKDFVSDIVHSILSYEGVLGVHDVIFHSYGKTKMFMTIHVEVDGYKDIMATHDLIDNIESDVERKYGVEISIHMDPIDTKNPELNILKEKIKASLDELNQNLTFHDLRIVKGPTHTNVIFDVSVPTGIKINNRDIVQHLKQSIDSSESTYNLVVKIENSYIHQ